MQCHQVHFRSGRCFTCDTSTNQLLCFAFECCGKAVNLPTHNCNVLSAQNDLDKYATNLCAFVEDNPDEEICTFGHECAQRDSAGPNVQYGATCDNKCVQKAEECDSDYGVCFINELGDANCG